MIRALTIIAVAAALGVSAAPVAGAHSESRSTHTRLAFTAEPVPGAGRPSSTHVALDLSRGVSFRTAPPDILQGQVLGEVVYDASEDLRRNPPRRLPFRFKAAEITLTSG